MREVPDVLLFQKLVGNQLRRYTGGYGKFFNFVTLLVEKICASFNHIVGIKLEFKGKFSRSLRKSKRIISRGRVPIGSARAKILCSDLAVRSKVGIFGLKFRVNISTPRGPRGVNS